MDKLHPIQLSYLEYSLIIEALSALSADWPDQPAMVPDVLALDDKITKHVREWLSNGT